MRAALLLSHPAVLQMLPCFFWPFVAVSSLSVFAARWTSAACAREHCTVMRLLFVCRAVKRLSFAFTEWKSGQCAL